MASTNPEYWHARLGELVREHKVPGAALAFHHQGKVHEFAAGTLNLDTGVEATPDSLFQIGSITKVLTATQIMLLDRGGQLSLDTTVAELLPGFSVADPAVSKEVTVRHLLSHTSGIDGDLLHDGGRGDDCIEKYVAACAELPQVAPLATTHSYCNAGYVILGRIIERLTGQVWDTALRQQIIDPLGLRHTWTLPEDVLRFRAATGHLAEPDGPLRTTPTWGMMRSLGPSMLLCASAADVVRFSLSHLEGGLFHFPEMWRPQVNVPNPHTYGPHWGLGWTLDSLDGLPLLRHAGNTVGQAAMLWMVPEIQAVACLLTNTGFGREGGLQQAVFTELSQQMYGLTARPLLEPPQTPVTVDLHRHTGVYERLGTRIVLTERDGNLHFHMDSHTPVSQYFEPVEMTLIPVDADTFVGRRPGEGAWSSLVFFTLPDGTPCLHYSIRATPKVG
ncbi:MAG TPA: serine hydrolase domain-containing protein [Streptosporangiaceae bacterium]|nr:serine hydrolase domain-containing protein [Streptosporangiaceae bacterium]